MSKRILSMVLMLTLILGSFSMAFADTTNVNAKLTTEQKIAELQRLGFIEGDQTGDLQLKKNIDRASVAAIVARAVLSGDDTDFRAEINKSNYRGIFADVTTAHWANASVNVATEKQITNGTNAGTPKMFSPSREITYIEVVTMMNRILNLDVNLGNGWKIGNIAAARDAGILEGIDATDFNYDDKANREVIFELLYNTVTNNKLANYNIDKVLVLENNRLESIGANELVVEVIKEVQRANFADDSRNQGNATERRGQQLRITLPTGSDFDVEDLTGKVIDLSYNTKNEAVRTQLDTTYSYVSGEIATDGDKLVVGKVPNEKSYTAIMDEKLSSRDDRVFRTYVNDKAYTYSNFAKDVKRADFANVTIKNGKVLFIDAFNFEDVAPVKEVKKDGSEVFVYNDSRDGDVKRIDFKDSTKVVAVKDGKFTRSTLKEIDALDVVHVYGDNKVIVRKDSKVNDTYTKVSEDKNGYFVTVGDKAYEISNATNKKSVYSYDSKKFYTLDPVQADRNLREFKDEKVTILLDIKNNVQYFGSEIEAGEFVAGVDSIVGKEARLIKSDGAKTDYAATLDTKIKLIDGTAHQNLNLLNKNDVVYVSAKENLLDKVYLLATKADVDNSVTGAKAVAKDKDGDYIINRNFITTDRDYKVLDRTNAFYYEDGKIVATTVEKLSKDKLVAGVQAYVITDFRYDEVLKGEAKRSTTGSKDVAHTIIFKSNPFKNETAKQKVQVIGVYASGSTYELEVKDSNGNKTTVTVEKDSKLHNEIKSAGLFEYKNRIVESVVEIEANKDDKKEAVQLTVLIDKNKAVYEVKSASSNSGYREITLVDRNNETKKFWTNTDVAEFGNVGTSGSKISFSLDKYNEINAIVVRNKEAVVSAWDQSAVRTNVLDRVIEADGKVILQIDGKLYQYAGKASEVKAFEGEPVTFERQTLNGVEYAYDVKLKATTPGETVNKSNLINTIVNAEKIDTTKNTVESVNLLKNAIAAAKSVRDNANATQAQVDTAVVSVNQAVAGLINKPAESDVKAVATKGKSALGITEYTITLEGAELKDITDVLVNGNSKKEMSELTNGVFSFRTDEKEKTGIKVVVNGKTIEATIK